MNFSIITPSFRQLSWLKLCVASVFDQRLSVGKQAVIEHIIQDGGSEGIPEFEVGVSESLGLRPDKPQRGEFFVARKENYTLRIYQEQDTGMYDALHKGLLKTSGDILSWLNCDEQYLPDTLARVSRAFKPESDLLCGDTILLNTQLTPRAYRKAVMPDPDFIQTFQLNLHSSSLFFRRETIKKYGFLPVEYCSISDAKWIHGLIRSKASFQIFSEPLSYFVLGDSNLSAAPISIREKADWAQELPLQPRSREQIRLRNIFSRLVHGAYFPRRTGAAVFTPENLLCRKRHRERWLDFRFRVK